MIYHARSIIAATGAFHRPYLPSLPGQDDFAGRVLHAATYRNPAPYAAYIVQQVQRHLRAVEPTVNQRVRGM